MEGICPSEEGRMSGEKVGDPVAMCNRESELKQRYRCSIEGTEQKVIIGKEG